MMKILQANEVSQVSAAGSGFFTAHNGLTYFLTFPTESQTCVEAYLADSQYRIDNNGRTNLSLNLNAVDICGGFPIISSMQFLEIIQTH
jgi:hypothetical protein